MSQHMITQFSMKMGMLNITKGLEHADHSPLSSAKVKECMELYFHSPKSSSWCCAYLSTRTMYLNKASQKVQN